MVLRELSLREVNKVDRGVAAIVSFDTQKARSGPEVLSAIQTNQLLHFSTIANSRATL
jgi:hypothetical protein